ncbi:hypothetical protein CYMTET_50462, partial [Cymbomonas tetramitiformis]
EVSEVLQGSPFSSRSYTPSSSGSRKSACDSPRSISSTERMERLEDVVKVVTEKIEVIMGCHGGSGAGSGMNSGATTARLALEALERQARAEGEQLEAQEQQSLLKVEQKPGRIPADMHPESQWGLSKLLCLLRSIGKRAEQGAALLRVPCTSPPSAVGARSPPCPPVAPCSSPPCAAWLRASELHASVRFRRPRGSLGSVLEGSGIDTAHRAASPVGVMRLPVNNVPITFAYAALQPDSCVLRLPPPSFTKVMFRSVKRVLSASRGIAAGAGYVLP